MFKRAIAVLLFAASFSAVAYAGPLHSSDPNYRGAFTLLASGNLSGAAAKYYTSIKISNLSDHDVYLRLELYSTNGYREIALLDNAVTPGFGGTATWKDGMLGLGAETMGALRVVAINPDGSDDLTADLRGYGRLWIEPYTGGRISEHVPGLTDYEASGAMRDDLVPGSGLAMFAALDATNARVNVTFVNFDKENDATFVIGERNASDSFGGTGHLDKVEVVVPAGSSRQVPLELMTLTGSNPPPNLPPVIAEKQYFAVARHGANGPWSVYATIIDNTTASSTLILDAATDSRQ